MQNVNVKLLMYYKLDGYLAIYIDRSTLVMKTV